MKINSKFDPKIIFFVKEGDTLKCVLSKVRTVAKISDSKKNVFGDFFEFSK